ncbi:single-stranded-DNA-specific exonuclease RecJ [Moraxella osloensis]|uniref:Single-stranded-DNA-specific exonuclease RecJ n=1 Tax=Faucicola osloensis TaxID=34062 RepID=A0AA91FL50_FAUOS|nr:single-stranded-DNA-specific exonuclease RecJ [Moraxella osloensis]OBX60553.1 single-stranded-DNA-specific exonuclease RecJ [Moraxella osloensis]
MLTVTPRFSATHIDEIPRDLQPLAQTSMTLARVLAGRGVQDVANLDTAFNKMLPANSLTGITKAVALLDKAIDTQQKILIVGDFDCDGATSTALMVRVLREMGAQVEFLVPDRFKYGYGLTPEIVALGIETYDPDVIVTVDNGISSHAGVELAKAKGLTVIITDHHLTTQATPNADAVVNPNQLGCAFASKSLVGVGVAFYVLGNLAKVRRQANKSTTQVSRYIDLVALGTVADVGVLDQNNRILVHQGIQAIKQGRCCVGILALLEQASRQAADITAQDFGFILGPRINAAGRMDSMRIGIDCLLTDDWGEAQRLAHQLDKLNQERRQVEQGMRQQADSVLTTLENPSEQNAVNQVTHRKRSIILYQHEWHQGVIGIVAGRLKESYHVPAIVFAPADTDMIEDDDSIKGSARSIEGIHIRDAIESVAQTHPELISHFGGHAMAAGLTIKRKNFEPFCKAFDEVVAAVADEVFAETLYSDGELTAGEFTVDFVDSLQTLAIWGHGFVAPIFDGVFVVQDYRVLKERHLKLWLSYPDVPFTIEAIWFNADFDAIALSAINRSVSKVHLLYELEKNLFNGQTKLQLRVKKGVLL